MALYESARNPLDPAIARAVELATGTGVKAARVVGAASGGTVASAPMPSAGTGADAEGFTRWPCFYDIDNYDDPRAVYLEDV